jgi:tRNA pseudouridine38-40 synthase
MRIALGIEYDGSSYNGWQSQKDGIGIQTILEQALSSVADHPVSVTCAGRTDTGVHASGQVIHFDSDAVRTARAWVMGANANLPRDVSVIWAVGTNDDFHARFSATSRAYRYIILNRSVRPAILANKVSWEHRPLDIEKMQIAGNLLLGEHDFSSYRAAQCQSKSAIRTITKLQVSRENDFVFIDIEANAFLQHMVRNIAGVLMTVGAGEEDTAWSRHVLDKRDRTQGGVTASPAGLYFIKVEYPEIFQIPEVPASLDILPY